MTKYMKKILLIIPAVILLSGCTIGGWQITKQTPPTTPDTGNQVACTQEAKICPDGTAVGRSGPNCEFAACPAAKPTGGKVLNLSGQGLTKVPNSVFNQTNLEELNVSNNKLTGAIQAEIRFLANLRVLNASNNQMTGVPAEVGQLSKLEVLDLSNNKLTGLPYELGNLKNLKTLNLSGNSYSAQDLAIIQKGLPANVKIIK
jgi:Leucine-rich repeat (LRR) protein